MNKIILLIIVICSFQVSYSQSGWYWQNPDPIGSQLEDVFFVNQNVGYSVGWDGTIIKTINGGLNWSQLNSGTNYFLTSLFFTSENTGFVVSGSFNFYPVRGAILKTTNGGLNWEIDYYSNIKLNSIFFINALTGFACGNYGNDYGILLKTTNSGSNWNQVNNLPATFFLTRIQFLDENTGFISDDQQVIKTTNGGGNWITTGNGVLNGLLSLYFVNNYTGYAAGNYGRIYKTTNSGTNWLLINHDTTTHLESIKFIDPNLGFAVGRNIIYESPGKLKKTTNGGISWDSISYGFDANLMAVSLNYDNSVIVVGARGTISKSTNLGNDWIPVTKSLSSSSLSGIQFTNDNQGFIVGANGVILKSTNRGDNWVVLNSGTTFDLYDLEVIENNEIVVCGANGKVLKTINGGLSWLSINVSSLYDYHSIDFVDHNTGFMVGSKFYTPNNYIGSILKSTNSGESWNSIYNNGSSVLHSICFLNGNTGFVSINLLAQGCKILKTIDGGQTWAQYPTAINTRANCFYFLDSLRGFAGGNYPLLKTTDCGNNWSLVNISVPFSFTINSIFFTNSNTGYLVCKSNQDFEEGGDIFKTNDGGNSWFHYTSTPSYPTYRVELNSVAFLDNNTGYALGNNGTILKTTNGGGPIGIKQLGVVIPNSFSIQQNYPNPFNPKTRIRFSIPQFEFTQMRPVQLIVYEALGREVQKLVNENLSPGEYQVDFDGSNLPSGVYFCSFSTSDINLTKKMVLLK